MCLLCSLVNSYESSGRALTRNQLQTDLSHLLHETCLVAEWRLFDTLSIDRAVAYVIGVFFDYVNLHAQMSPLEAQSS